MSKNTIPEELIEPAANSVNYDSYLKISQLLTMQHPLSVPKEHDEILFIVIHQVYELWFKQILHEVGFCTRALAENQIMPFMIGMKRIITIQSVLTNQVDILETMTPTDFNRFRERLNPASGFQSMQFRLLEFLLGLKNKEYLKFHKHRPEDYQILANAINSPSLYDQFLHFLARKSFPVPQAVLSRDVTLSYEPDAGVESVLFDIYNNPSRQYDLFMALETLIDFDQKLLLWRYRHVAMVSRMIGNNKGTGGSSGVDYLSKTLVKRCFPELWLLRDRLTASSSK